MSYESSPSLGVLGVCELWSKIMSQWLSHRHTQKKIHSLKWSCPWVTYLRLPPTGCPPSELHCLTQCVCVCVFVTPSVGHAGSQLQQQSVISISTGLLCSGSSRPCPAAERSHQCVGTRSDTLWAPPGSSPLRISARYTTIQFHYYPSAHIDP